MLEALEILAIAWSQIPAHFIISCIQARSLDNRAREAGVAEQSKQSSLTGQMSGVKDATGFCALA